MKLFKQKLLFETLLFKKYYSMIVCLSFPQHFVTRHDNVVPHRIMLKIQSMIMVMINECEGW